MRFCMVLIAILAVGLLSANPAFATTTVGPGEFVKVVDIKAKAKNVTKKNQRCFAYAEKHEFPAPPVDPYASCTGKVKIRIKAKAEAGCKSGYFGGSASFRVTVYQRIKARAWARAIASGRADAKARTIIRDTVRIKGWAKVTCVPVTPPAPPVTPPQPTPTPSPTPTPTPTPQPKVIKPTAKASCPPNYGAGLVVTVGNEAGADIAVQFDIGGFSRTPAIGTEQSVTLTDVVQGQVVTVYGNVGGKEVFRKELPPRNCPSPPPPKEGKPDASKKCPPNYGAGLLITVSNGSDATSDVDFYFDGVYKTTLSPGASLEISSNVAQGGTVTVTAKLKGGSSVIFTKSFTRDCPSPPQPKPSVKVTPYCPPNGGPGTITVAMTNSGPSGTQVTFTIKFDDNPSFTHTVDGGSTDYEYRTLGVDQDVRVVVSAPGMTTYNQLISKCPKPPAPKPSAVATASCPPGGGNGSGVVNMTNTGDAGVTFTVSISGSSTTTHTVGAGGAASRNFTVGTDNDVTVTVSAPGMATYTEKFTKCKKVPPPQPPTVTNVTQPQELYVDETYPNFCADVTSPAGHSVKVVFGARFGVGFTKTITSTGSDRVCGTYTAPSDLPFTWTPPSWSGLTKSDTWDQVHVVATDLTTGLSSTGAGNPPPDVQSYVWFPIMRKPPVCC